MAWLAAQGNGSANAPVSTKILEMGYCRDFDCYLLVPVEESSFDPKEIG